MFSNVAFWVFVICAVALAIGTVWLIKSYRDAKHAAYFFLREEAALRVKRLMFVLVPLAVVVVFLGLRLFGPEEEVPPGPGETPTIVETSTLSPAPLATDTLTPEPTGTITATVAVPTEEAEVQLAATLTPTGTAVITGTPVLTLTATSPVTPTVTGTSVPVSVTVTSAAPTGVITGTVESSVTGVITGTVEPSLTEAITGTVEPSPTPTATDTPVFSTVTPDPDTTVESIVFALAATSDNKPKNPLRVFPPGDDQIYAFFEYHEMKNGVAWRHVWYKESEELASEGGLWEWGTDGRAYVFFSPVGGFKPGRYMVQIYIGGELRRSGTFVVR
jgi:hypothetical protein